jgi:putative SOS response-associated peptidase YedK
LEYRGLDDGKTKRPYFIRRAGHDPMVFARLELATTSSKGA